MTSYILFALLLIAGSPAGVTSGLAQDDLGTPVDGGAALQTEEPVETPPSEELEPPVGEVVEQPGEPDTDIEEAPADEQPSEEPLPPDQIATPELPNDEPTPTATAAYPSLVIDQPIVAKCELQPGQAGTAASGGTQSYTCRADLGLTGSTVDPSAVAIDWAVDVTTSGAWTVQLRSNADQPWSDPAAPPVLAAQSLLDEVISASDTGFSTSESLSFELLVTRPTCELNPVTVQVQISASPLLNGETVGRSALPEPLRLEPSLAAIGQPVVTFTGPLDFGTIGATASGPETSTLSGTLGLAVTGLDTTCGAWQIAIGGSGMVDADGQQLPGSELLVLPTTENGVACDIRAGCQVALLTGDAATEPTKTISLDLELRLGGAVVTGTFSTSLTVTITPADGPI